MNIRSLALAGIGVLCLSTAANAQVAWKLYLSGIADSTNVIVNGTQIKTCNGSGPCTVALDSYFVSGINSFELQQVNNNDTAAGWSFDWKLTHDGKLYWEQQCGEISVEGCLANQTNTGIVFDISLAIFN